MHLLFVCTGNICRSPIAERLGAAYATKYPASDLTMSSAGVHAAIGHPIHPEAARVLRELGGDAENFSARQFTPRNASDADLILTMTKVHRDEVLQQIPRMLHRTYLLTEAAQLASGGKIADISELEEVRHQIGARELVDIADPLGQSPEMFARIGSQIACALTQVIDFCARPV